MNQRSSVQLSLLILLSFFIPACGDDDPFIPTPEPTVTATPIPNPICTSVKGSDGAGGFLWKPKSDNTGTLVVLFPSDFTEKFKQVTVIKKKDGKEEKLVFSAFANGNRQHWRGKLAGGKYTGLVTTTSPDENICQWKVKTPAKRVD